MRALNRSILLTTCIGMVLFAGCSKLPETPAATTPQAQPVAKPAPAVAAASARTASEEKLAWLAGDWCGNDEEQELEESWLAPRANEAIGMSRTLAGGRMLSFEFMRIIDREGSPTYVAQPNGEPPTYFKKTGGGEGWIRFENKQHDYPQRIEYRKLGEGLLAEIGGPGAEGKEEVISYRYQRCPK